MSDNGANTTVTLRWVIHGMTFSSLMLGRIEIAVVCVDGLGQGWVCNLRFCDDHERDECSRQIMQTEAAAKVFAETHAAKVLA